MWVLWTLASCLAKVSAVSFSELVLVLVDEFDGLLIGFGLAGEFVDGPPVLLAVLGVQGFYLFHSGCSSFFFQVGFYFLCDVAVCLPQWLVVWELPDFSLISRFSLIFSSSLLLILMSPCLDLVVGQLSWRQEAITVVISSMCLSMDVTELAWCSPRRWLNLFIAFSLYMSQSHLFRLLEVQIG